MRLIRQATLSWRDLGFFAIALLIHSALLLLPIKAWQTHQAASERRSELLQVHLQPAAKMPASTIVPAQEIQALAEDLAPPHPDQKKSAADYILAEIPLPADKRVPDDQLASDALASQNLNTQQLRLWAEQADGLAPPQQASLALGAAKSYRPPDNWNRNSGTAFFSSFDDRSHEVALPADASVVDRWQAADGSHQVMVQLPNGDSLCGRAAAYNPMQALVEPVMMFSSCGSTPTFTMPERYNQGR